MRLRRGGGATYATCFDGPGSAWLLSARSIRMGRGWFVSMHRRRGARVTTLEEARRLIRHHWQRTPPMLARPWLELVRALPGGTGLAEAILDGDAAAAKAACDLVEENGGWPASRSRREFLAVLNALGITGRPRAARKAGCP